jgi:KaiC/GvpD/RAD55 family RecA-like ATPase
VALQVKADTYFDAIRLILDGFAAKKGLHTIYVTCTIPSKSIINALEILEVDISKVYFVDCVSSMMMGLSERHERTVYVESPSMLEMMMLKIEFLVRKLKQDNVVVILDSINSLAIHNNPKVLSEFLHILINHLRSKNAYTILFAMQEYTNEEIRNMIDLVADQTINLG